MVRFGSAGGVGGLAQNSFSLADDAKLIGSCIYKSFDKVNCLPAHRILRVCAARRYVSVRSSRTWFQRRTIAKAKSVVRFVTGGHEGRARGWTSRASGVSPPQQGRHLRSPAAMPSSRFAKALSILSCMEYLDAAPSFELPAGDEGASGTMKVRSTAWIVSGSSRIRGRSSGPCALAMHMPVTTAVGRLISFICAMPFLYNWRRGDGTTSAAQRRDRYISAPCHKTRA